jgi:hypothetical protein
MSPSAEPPFRTWSELPRAAKAFRVAHAAWAMVSLAALGIVWRTAISRRRGQTFALSIVWLGIEGAALIAGRGDCPLGPFQARLGDPVPLFELVLPRRGAKVAVPVLSVAAAVGIALAWARPSR